VTSLVLELQSDALNSSVSCLELLRKALVVARKLKIADFQEWIELELTGYGHQDPIPEYREIRGVLRAWNPYHGWQPIAIDNQQINIFLGDICNCSVHQSMSELVILGNSKNKELTIQLPFQAESLLVSLIGTKIKISVSTSSIQSIVEAVRDIILRWSLQLEEDGIVGEGITFSPQEKQRAADHDYSHFIQVKVEQSQVQNSHLETEMSADIFNNDLRGSNVANFANKVQDNAQQIASDFSQGVNQNLDEILRLVDNLREMTQQFPESKREEALVHLDDLQEDITTPGKQKSQRIRTRIVALLSIAGVIARTTDFANNVLELSEKLGIPIDINVPQLVQDDTVTKPIEPFSSSD
jgi:hypothetical protein